MKDRQERLIFIFTVVTVGVLFLAFAWPERLPPLSSLFSRGRIAGSFYTGSKPEREVVRVVHRQRFLPNAPPAEEDEEIEVEP
jgi:hypothetical protein